MLLVTANTMAQSVRERTPEIGVLKTLGFTGGLVTALVLVESIVITATAAVPRRLGTLRRCGPAVFGWRRAVGLSRGRRRSR
jgi:predicted lysophospholipase L1 biosynthesis ABC-type transport system permease subunit